MSFESAMFNSQKSFQRCDTYSQCIRPSYVIPLPYNSWRFANNCKNKISHQLMQPHPQGILLVQNGGSEKILAKATEILQELWSILSFDTWWNGFFGGCFQRLVALFVFLHSETVVQTERRHFIMFYVSKSSRIFAAILAALARVSPIRHFEWGEGPGDEFDCCL